MQHLERFRTKTEKSKPRLPKGTRRQIRVGELQAHLRKDLLLAHPDKFLKLVETSVALERIPEREKRQYLNSLMILAATLLPVATQALSRIPDLAPESIDSAESILLWVTIVRLVIQIAYLVSNARETVRLEEEAVDVLDGTPLAKKRRQMQYGIQEIMQAAQRLQGETELLKQLNDAEYMLEVEHVRRAESNYETLRYQDDNGAQAARAMGDLSQH